MTVPTKTFKNDVYVNFNDTGIESVSQHPKENIKIIKFSSDSSLEKILSYIAKPEYPNVFVYVFKYINFENFDEKFKTIKKFLINEAKNRPTIVKLESKDYQMTFYYFDEDQNDYIEVNSHKQINEDSREISKFLHNFITLDPEEYQNFVYMNLIKSRDSPLILRFLRTVNFESGFLTELPLMCAELLTKNDLLAALGAPSEGQGRLLSKEAEKCLYEVVNEEGTDTSILSTSVKYSNEDVINYLISNCTHLIQKLPFEHQIDISTDAFIAKKFDILCDLLEFSDFPFPKQFNASSTNHERFIQIYQDRMEFHEAIKNKNANKINKFIENNSNLRIVFSIINQSAMCTAIESKNFEEFYRFKSRGFEAELSEDCENRKSLTENDKKALSKQALTQTKINADSSISDKEKTVVLLSSRSLIHNRKYAKVEESRYRENIKKWFSDLYKLKYCKELLDVAVQCEELKIVFDFESKSVSFVNFFLYLYRGEDNLMGNFWIYHLQNLKKLKPFFYKISGSIFHNL